MYSLEDGIHNCTFGSHRRICRIKVQSMSATNIVCIRYVCVIVRVCMHVCMLRYVRWVST
jgi:hypothetical protein